LAVSLSTLVISFSLLISRVGQGVSEVDGGRTVAGQIVGVLGVVSTLALWGGFWRRSDLWMQIGLLLTSGAWFARAVFIVLDQGWTESVFLSLCWALASVGAFTLEHFTGAAATHRRHRE
jgi:hypothetical protein